MAFGARKAALARPSAVAVHHDRNMTRQAVGLEREAGKFVQWE
jgi:hypothetical protein